ncbi:oxidoreductase [Larsenimonas rhizosphaerae]|uniref:Oxidoreductase n=1 Tax=Larsenimonas rhizosphaerae TaxID=2944682 RepID=A0AA42CVL1_9GAMM|nr:oxidoreductase [Larsenimonas rhizosphaerae]MCX2525066.1 oxidoreductase [Larsenimonas rhizosphaerae]
MSEAPSHGVSRVALIGFGLAGKAFHAPLISTTPGLELSRVVTRQTELVHAEYPEAHACSLQDALNDDDIDLVVVATPNDTHAEIAMKALEHGKHVVVDKPFALSLDEATLLARKAEGSGLMLAVFHNRRWDADFLTIRALLEEGTLGELKQFESCFNKFRPAVDHGQWKEQPGPGSGNWMDLGAHLGDQALQLFGRPDGIYADLGILREGGQATDYFHVVLRYNGFRVLLHGGVVACEPAPRFSLHGTTGSYTIYGMDPQEAALRSGARPGFEGWGADPVPGTITRHANGHLVRETWPSLHGNYPAFYEGVRHALQHNGDAPVSLSSALDTMRLLELGKQSAEQRREVYFDSTI